MPSSNAAMLARVKVLALRSMLEAGGVISTPAAALPTPQAARAALDLDELRLDAPGGGGLTPAAAQALEAMPPALAHRLRVTLDRIERGPAPAALAATPAARTAGRINSHAPGVSSVLRSGQPAVCPLRAARWRPSKSDRIF